MNPNDVLYFSGVACAIVMAGALSLAFFARHETRRVIAVGIVGALGFAVLSGSAMARVNDQFEAVVNDVEAKYGVEVEKPSRMGTADAPADWVIDGDERECFLDGQPGVTDFRGYTDPVLKCQVAAVEFDATEFGADD